MDHKIKGTEIFFSYQQWQIIGSILAQRPYAEVGEIIPKIAEAFVKAQAQETEEEK